MDSFEEKPWSPTTRRPMAAARKASTSSQLVEAIQHLQRVTALMMEWQTDWAALLPTLPSGRPNEDYDPLYEAKIRETPEEIFDPAVLEARNFLKRINSH
jgi:hypothetical protein